VVENAALPLVLDGLTDAEAHDRAMHALHALGLAKLADKLPEEISSGQAQRVAVARVLAMTPPLIIADEPTGQLDHATAERVIDVLVETADRLGAALVIATHDLAMTRRLSTRWIVRDGTILTSAPVTP
jgi:putative ABC transport system ATP-binding protein